VAYDVVNRRGDFHGSLDAGRAWFRDHLAAEYPEPRALPPKKKLQPAPYSLDRRR
jgi:hypothetical protein